MKRGGGEDNDSAAADQRLTAVSMRINAVNSTGCFQGKSTDHISRRMDEISGRYRETKYLLPRQIGIIIQTLCDVSTPARD